MSGLEYFQRKKKPQNNYQQITKTKKDGKKKRILIGQTRTSYLFLIINSNQYLKTYD